MFKYMKAYLACAVAVVGSLITAASDGHITLVEGLVAAGAGLAALSGVAQVGNKKGTTR